MRFNATNKLVAILATVSTLMIPSVQADQCDQTTLFRLTAYLSEIQQDQRDTITAIQEVLDNLDQRVENARPYLVQKAQRLAESRGVLIRECQAGRALACTKARELEEEIQELRALISGGILQGNVNRVRNFYITRTRSRFQNLSDTADGIIRRIVKCQ